jgi:pSer/pThr/pTyr-binding forkhead associated (FHA) protein
VIVKIRAVNGKKAGTTFLVWKSPYIIGRHEQADLRIGNTQVSVYHCSILIRANEVWVRDMDSTNGTFLNDEQITGEHRIGIGDQLRIGPAVFEIIQEATGAIPDEQRENYTSTQVAIPAPPTTSRVPAKNPKQ